MTADDAVESHQLRELLRETRAAETLLRKLLWIRHGCEFSALYGDDGEMQCHRCRLDFRRMAPAEIEARWRATGEAALKAALKTEGGTR